MTTPVELDVKIGGQTYSLDDATYCYLQEYEGWCSAPINRITQAGALQHGDTDLGYRLSPRVARLKLFINGSTLGDLRDKRRALLRILAPQLSPHQWRFTLSATTYAFDGYPVNVEMPQSWQQGLTCTVVVRVRCNDPLAYNPTINEVVFSLPAIAAGMPVDTPVDTEIGTSSLSASENITYTGDVFSYPLIRVLGPITSPTITNTTTSEVLDFPGITIGPGDYYDIDCRYANKSVTDGDGVNRIAELSADSDMATFHLAAAVDGTGSRVNTITVTGAGVTASTAVTLWYYTRYGGI